MDQARIRIRIPEFIDKEHNEPKLYSYRPLETPRAIRILELHPGSDHQALVGRLTHFDLGSLDLPHYKALSYVWGKPIYERLLSTSNGDLLLTRSLEEALKRVRSPKHIRYIWADGVCINQEDLKERGHQVKLMGSIYRSASTVTVWLGPDPNNHAKETFHFIQDAVDDKWNYKVFEVLEWKLLLELFGCRWFERLWVVQEVVMARKAIVYWGKEQTDFRNISFAAWKYAERIPQSRSSWVVQLFPNAFSFHFDPEADARLLFLDVLRWTRHLKCSDDHDKIYAILGLPYSREKKLNKIAERIEPDYTRSVADVYYEVAFLISSHGKLSELLNAVHHRTGSGPLA